MKTTTARILRSHMPLHAIKPHETSIPNRRLSRPQVSARIRINCWCVQYWRAICSEFVLHMYCALQRYRHGFANAFSLPNWHPFKKVHNVNVRVNLVSYSWRPKTEELRQLFLTELQSPAKLVVLDEQNCQKACMKVYLALLNRGWHKIQSIFQERETHRTIDIDIDTVQWLFNISTFSILMVLFRQPSF